MPFLEIKNIKKHFQKKKGGLFSNSFDTVKAVDGVSIQIEKGEILGLVGESGCGKSTLSKTIMQLIPPTEGEVILENDSLTTLNAEKVRKRRLDFQMIFQDPYASLNPRMTVWSTLKEAIITRHGKLNHKELENKVTILMERVGLDQKFMRKYPHEFSGGQRQRIAIARALALNPEIIICDEAVSALDVSIQAQIINLLKDLRNKFSLSYIFIAHDLPVVRDLADRVIVMKSGEILEEGNVEEVFNNPSNAYTIDLLKSSPSIEKLLNN